MSSAPLLLTEVLRPRKQGSVQPGWPAFFSAWLPVFLFLCVLAVESTSAFGADRTSRPLHAIFHGCLGSGVDRNWSLLHHLIRKTGHFLGYGTLSLLVLRGLVLTVGDSMRRVWVLQAASIGAACLAASLDEIHQTFLPNRTGKFSDVLLDTAGALGLQLLWAAVASLRARARRPAPVASGAAESLEAPDACMA